MKTAIWRRAMPMTKNHHFIFVVLLLFNWNQFLNLQLYIDFTNLQFNSLLINDDLTLQALNKIDSKSSQIWTLISWMFFVHQKFTLLVYLWIKQPHFGINVYTASKPSIRFNSMNQQFWAQNIKMYNKIEIINNATLPNLLACFQKKNLPASKHQIARWPANL